MESVVHYSYLYNRQLRQNRRRLLRFIALIIVACAVVIGLVFFVTSKNGLSLLNQISTIKFNLGATNTADLTLVPIGHDYGIAAGGSLTDLNQQQLEQTISGIAALGVKWIRFDFKWSLIQPDNSKTYNWSQYDSIVQLSANHGLHVLGILDFTPAWARSSACQDTETCQPASDSSFATFAAAVSHRYKTIGLHYWEIWNEPNSPQFWQPGANPAAYAHLLESSYQALHNEDGDAYVITAGLSPQATTGTSYSPIDFLNALYNDGAKGSFDAVGDHPYTFPQLPSTSADHAWNQMASTAQSLRQTMVKNGDSNKKIWVTESGAPTNGPDPQWYVSEANQAVMLSDALRLYQSYSWVGPFFWYSYKDAGTTTDTNENFFGLVRADGSQKPAFAAYQQAAKALTRTK